MADLAGPLRRAIETGQVVLGLHQVRRALQSDQARLVIRASNCPDEFLGTPEDVPVEEFPGSNVELGAACGKPFSVSAVAVLDPGKSKILKR
ncbi:MAG: 50S ribosomal protein L30e [Candidatus Thermoplasmatota archaeon]|nr:50S ribosomal protein L30e [Candidatus Thermoplasmatota archaeon]